MGFSSISQFATTPLFQALFDAHEIAAPIFGLKLAQEGSELSLGGTDSSGEEFTYVPVETEVSKLILCYLFCMSIIPQSFWNIRLDGVALNGTLTLGSGQAMIDTATPLILAPLAEAEQLYASIPGSAAIDSADGSTMYTFPCAASHYTSLIFGGKAFAIRPELFNLGRVEEEEDCVGAVVGSDNTSFWVVGDAFLQNVYSIFDAGKGTVGFAVLR